MPFLDRLRACTSLREFVFWDEEGMENAFARGETFLFEAVASIATFALFSLRLHGVLDGRWFAAFEPQPPPGA